jgi:hypothetical protein
MKNNVDLFPERNQYKLNVNVLLPFTTTVATPWEEMVVTTL